MVKKVVFSAGAHEIEGLFSQRTGDRGVVVTHPHPLYGGDMYNMVVDTMVHAYQHKGYSTLKFNFRGVGKSQGKYADGIGEQEDVIAAMSYLAKTGIEKIDLAGYSFGAWVNAHAVRRDAPVKNMVMVSPPVGFMAFRPTAVMDGLKLVITGTEDDIAPAKLVQSMLPSWNPEARLELIDGADHFWGGYLDVLGSVLSSHI